MKLLYKGQENNHRDVELDTVVHSSVTPGQSYRLQIKGRPINEIYIRY